MARQTLVPDAAQRIERYGAHLLRGKWRDPATGRVCGMAALVDGTMSRDDCIALGNWPEWLPAVVITLFEAEVGGDELAASAAWWGELAIALATPRDYERAHHRFVADLLRTVAELGHGAVAQPAFALHEHALAGNPPAPEEWSDAEARAEFAAADALTNAARYAALAAAWAARRDVPRDGACEVARHAARAARHAAFEARGITSYDGLAEARTAGYDAQRAARSAHRRAFLAALAAAGDEAVKPESELPAGDTAGTSSPWKEIA